MMQVFKFALVILTCTFTFSCSGGQSEIDDGNTSTTDDLLNTDVNILFVGNSLTYTNNLPELVKDRAKLKDVVIGTKMIAKGNYAIIDHWTDGEVQKEIASGNYDYVVIQQGPSSQVEGREMLIKDGRKYKEICEENDSELVYYMVWPSRTYYESFDDVIKNYRDAASINDAILCPVGEVWKEHFDLTNNFDYYGIDGFHPSFMGSRVAADVIIESLFP